MKPIRWVLSALVAGVVGATSAQAEPCGAPPLVPGDPGVVAPNCIDCSGGCTVYKYGLGHPDNSDFRRSNDPFVRDQDDFPTGSYAIIRADLNNPNATNCGPERDFTPIQGQWLLREQDGCVPTSEGPEGLGGCPVEIPRQVSDNCIPGAQCPAPGPTTPARDKATWMNATLSSAGVVTILGSSSATLGGTSNPNYNGLCLPTSIRLLNARGTRYRLPATHPLYDGTGAQTYIQWLNVQGQGLYRHEDDSEFCCTSTTTTGCSAIPGGFTEYPVMLKRHCAQTGTRIFELLDTNDWIFEAGPDSDFVTDPEHIITGQVHGVCRTHRFQGCTRPGTNAQCTGLRTPHSCCLSAGNGTCGTECDVFGDGDTCDLREPGHRQTRPGNLASGFPSPAACNTAVSVFRGYYNRYCTINSRYEVNGDPGGECRVWNFGFHPRPDLDCDGVEDDVANGGVANDLCPFFNEFDYFKDTDLDCAGDSVRCRGDECECTDQNQDGGVSVTDLTAINVEIFQPAQLAICDGNNDLLCTVSDIVSANREIFTFDSSACRHITSIQCGDFVVQTGEPCDDGARCQGGAQNGMPCNAVVANPCGLGATCLRRGGDGCNAACRIEPGYQCSGSPSVCTPL